MKKGTRFIARQVKIVLHIQKRSKRQQKYVSLNELISAEQNNITVCLLNCCFDQNVTSQVSIVVLKKWLLAPDKYIGQIFIFRINNQTFRVERTMSS